ncbi:hypothetical protein [Methanogenium cariaci]|uniref:hypothetical protein n=1 Tax=Methanogenium cariaci TaxID=2197 RepID=UPI00155DCAC1|nr:hypothetical protein [Methanogenium cariaci]
MKSAYSPKNVLVWWFVHSREGANPPDRMQRSVACDRSADCISGTQLPPFSPV